MCKLCELKSGMWSSRRAFVLTAAASVGALAAAPALAQVDVGKPSKFRIFVSADEVEAEAARQYLQMMEKSRAQKALSTDNDSQLLRLRGIARRIIPHAAQWNSRATQWKWEVNLIVDKQINAFCMPGGKIAFFTGILDQLKLTDDEAAMVMGHEMAHALREHARERIAKTGMTGWVSSKVSHAFGLGNLGDAAAKIGTELASRKFSREDESEADLVGLELAARSGYDPQAGASLWRKMAAAAGSANGKSFLSTHPSGPDRIRQLEANAPKVQGLYEQARKAG